MYKKNFKKNDLAKKLSDKSGYSINFSKKLINDIVEIIVLNIKKDNFTLKNIGSFKKKYKKERIGRNPKTKEEFIIHSRKSISFTSSTKLLEKLNKFI